MLETRTRPNPVQEMQRQAEVGLRGPPPRPAPAAGRHGKRGSGVLLGFLLLVVLPTLGFGTWQMKGASDQFAVEIRFAVRPVDPSRAALSSGMLAGAMAGNTDAYAVVQNLQSRAAIQAVSRHADVRAILGRKEADPFSRLDPDAPLETALRVWRHQVQPYYDRASGIVTVEIRAFNAADAMALAQAVQTTSEALVNDMSARSRAELMAAAERDVAQAEARFASARAAVQAFRDSQQVVDPRRNAQAYSEHLVKLQSELIAMRAQLATLRAVMSDSAHPVMQLLANIRGTEEQIAAIQGRLTDPGTGRAGSVTLSQNIGGFEALETEAIFAQRAYEAAMTALERARGEASRQQVYLAPVVGPVAPERAIYPARIANTLTVFAASLLAWFVGLIALRALREHLA